MNYTHRIPNSLRKTAALLAIASLLVTSLPIGVLTTYAEEVNAEPTEISTPEVVSESSEQVEDSEELVEEVEASEEVAEQQEATEIIDNEESGVDEVENIPTISDENESATTTEDVASSSEEVASSSDDVVDEENKGIVSTVIEAASAIVKEAVDLFSGNKEVTLQLGENGVATVDNVKLGVAYVAPQNSQVKVTFTSLPEVAGSLSIEEVILTDEQVASLGAISNVAYDITSSMENGMFAYDLELPLPSSANEVPSIVYAESVDQLSNADIISDDSVQVQASEDTVTISELNHFTIFVVVHTPQEFGGLTWSPDRTNPTGGWTATPDQLVINVHGPSASPEGYYKTEGVKATLPSGNNSVKANLYIDSSWSSVTDVRAGLWGVLSATTTGSLAWPIIEFTNLEANPRIRVWDTANGGWTDVASSTYGTSVSLEVLQNPYTNQFEFFVDGSLVHSYSSIIDGHNFNQFNETIFNSFNGGQSYTTIWSDLELGEVTETPTIPTAIFTATPSNTVVSNGGYTQEQYFTFDLSSSLDVNRYQLKYWNDIVGSVFKEATPWNPTNLALHSSSLGVYNDNFTQGEGTHYFAFSACNSSDDCSNYSDPFVVTYDATGPSVPEITFPNPEQIFTTAPILNEWTVVTDASGIDYYQIAYRYDDGHTFSASTCPDVTIDGDWVGCRDVDGTSRNHIPSTSEQGGVTIWVRAFDNAGNVSGWSDPVHYYYDVDGSGPMNGTPAVPTGLGWNDSNSNPVADGGTTELVSGTAVWDANTEPDFSHYIYKYWNNISTSAFNSTSTAWTVNNGSANSRSGSFNQGEGTHYFCIIAVDNGGHESECSDEFTIVYKTTPSTPPSFTSGTTTVEAEDLSSTNWFFYNDQTGSIDGAEGVNNSLGSFVTGPAGVLLGLGSVEISVPVEVASSTNARRNLATYQFSNVKLADITDLKFSTYSQSAGNGAGVNAAPYLHFNVDFNGTDTWQRRLIYVPRDNGTVLADTWQEWDAINGGNALWKYSGANWPAELGGDSGSVTKTWNQIKAAFPNAGTRTTDSFLGVRVGEPYPGGFTGNIDNFVIGIKTGNNTHTEAYDFEPTTNTVIPETNTDTDGGGGGGGGGTNRSATPRVLGASTDGEIYDLLEQIKNRLAEFLLASYVSAQSPAGQSSGVVLGDSITQADLQLVQEAKDAEGQEENEITEMTVNEEDEDSEGAILSSWQNYYWLLVLLWLLASAVALWRRNEYPETMAMRAVQSTFMAVALLLLAGAVFFGLVGAFWPSLIVTIGAITAYFWSLE